MIEAACALAGLQFEVFRHIPYDLMPMAYRRYRVFASASRSDRMSLAVGEALCSGCRVISSTANRGNEWYYGLATVSPDSAIVEWAKWLRAAHECATWDDRPNMAARAMTWDVVAERLKVEYERALV